MTCTEKNALKGHKEKLSCPAEAFSFFKMYRIKEEGGKVQIRSAEEQGRMRTMGRDGRGGSNRCGSDEERNKAAGCMQQVRYKATLFLSRPRTYGWMGQRSKG